MMFPLIGSDPPLRLFPISFVALSIWRLLNYFTGGFGYETPSYNLRATYDYIIVGGGSSGCALASRLTEEDDATVLMLERGPGMTLLSHFTGTLFPSHFDPHSFIYRSMPQNINCQGYQHHSCSLLKGSALGGSSTTNFMMFQRGNRRDFEEWKNLGLTNWGYKDVLPYFKKFENNKDVLLSRDGLYHNTGGPVTINTLQYRSPLGKAWLDAGRLSGYPTTDLNGISQTGFMNQQGFFEDGYRITAASAYLDPIWDRKNLHISLYTTVTKILIDSGGHAYGVSVDKDGLTARYYARREIIVTTGPFETPKLLKLSGIGPKEELKNHNITVKADLPVGVDMTSRVGLMGLCFHIKKPISFHFIDLIGNPWNLYNWLFRSSGMWVGDGGFEGVAHIKTNRTLSDDNPDVGVLFLANSFAFDGGLYYNNNVLRMKQQIMDKFSGLTGQDSFQLIPYIIKPKSKGSVLLQSNNPFDDPLIVGNYFRDKDDVKKMDKGIVFSLRLGNSKPFKKFGSSFVKAEIPECKGLTPWQKKYRECFIRHMTYPLMHDVGTAKMGPPDASWSVVDPEMRVYGISGLRVVDVSVSPTITYGAWSTPAYMLAERAGDMIKSYWKTYVNSRTPYRNWPKKDYNNNKRPTKAPV